MSNKEKLLKKELEKARKLFEYADAENQKRIRQDIIRIQTEISDIQFHEAEKIIGVGKWR